MDMANDSNLVEIWLRKDPKRWAAGLMAGLFAGLVSLAFGMLLSVVGGIEMWMPVKYLAIPFLGYRAMETGFILPHILLGFCVYEALCMVWGLIYAHFTGTNSPSALLGVGLTWGAFSWIFLFCLFMPAFRQLFVASVSPGAAFAVCMVYGISLSSVSLFDRILRG